MSLYSNVYWTKRIIVIFSVVLFICSGWRIFTFVSGRLTIITPTVSYRQEGGFTDLEKLTINTKISTPPDFQPNEFINDTIFGQFSVDNGEFGVDAETVVDYPTQNDKSPVANVFKIQQGQIGLNATEIPYRIAKNFGFKKEPLRLESVKMNWRENNKDLEIDGQFLKIRYQDFDLIEKSPTSVITLSDDPESLKRKYEEIMRKYGIINADDVVTFGSYAFQYEYGDYVNDNSSQKIFVPNGSRTSGNYIKIYGVRTYENYVKPKKDTQTTAIYPNPNSRTSNNYIVLNTNPTASFSEREQLVEISLFNWPIVQYQYDNPRDPIANENVRTYFIKTPREAFNELKSSNNTLVSATDKVGRPLQSEELSKIQKVHVMQIKMQMYEDTINTSYIQPVYVFYCTVEEEDKDFRLMYIIPALTI